MYLHASPPEAPEALPTSHVTAGYTMRLESTTGACPLFQADFSDFLDDRLSDVRTAEMRAHVDNCERCLHHLSAYRRGVTVYRSIELGDPPVDFYDRLQARLRREARSPEQGGDALTPVPPAVGMMAVAVFAFALFWTGWEAGRATSPVGVAASAPPRKATVAIQGGENKGIAAEIDLTEWIVQVALAVP
jgi:anti-sigma factor RsiW